jgi:hypothetical protein
MKSVGTLYGVETSILGYYYKADMAEDVFSIDTKDQTGMSRTCPRCGGIKLTNVVSGLSFGNMPHERVRGKEDISLCQSCFVELSN